jgi:proliferating cell nuclear antigen PCNA
MFRATLVNAGLFKESISIISNVIKGDCTFHLSHEGISMVAMDPANISMVIFNFLAPAFEHFSIDEAEIMTINLDSFTNILKRAKSSDKLTLTLNKEKNRLKIIFEGQSTREFDIPLLEPQEERRQAPELDFAANAEINAEIFKESIEDAGIMGDTIILDVTPKKISVKSEGGQGSAKIDITKAQGGILNLDVKENAKVTSKYSIDYLKKMVSGGKIASTVKLGTGDNYPLKLDFVEVDKIRLCFILAPRVDVD